MLGFILDNLATAAVLAILLAVCAAVVVIMAKRKKRGKRSCGCSCADCPMREKCNK